MIGKYDGITVVFFGFGSVDVMTSERNSSNPMPSMSFAALDEPVDIGRSLPDRNGKTDIELGAKVRMMFAKPESIDVVIEGLERLKKSMEAEA